MYCPSQDLFQKKYIYFCLDRDILRLYTKNRDPLKGVYIMEVYERIRFLRKNILKMTQTEFAEHLGVTRTVIKNIELNSLARPDQKLSLYKLICSEFNVREEWLLNNEGEIYENNKIEFSELIERIMSGENEFAKNIFKTFALFDEKDWESLQHMIDLYKNASNKDNENPPQSVMELEKLYKTENFD